MLPWPLFGDAVPRYAWEKVGEETTAVTRSCIPAGNQEQPAGASAADRPITTTVSSHVRTDIRGGQGVLFYSPGSSRSDLMQAELPAEVEEWGCTLKNTKYTKRARCCRCINNSANVRTRGACGGMICRRVAQRTLGGRYVTLLLRNFRPLRDFADKATETSKSRCLRRSDRKKPRTQRRLSPCSLSCCSSSWSSIFFERVAGAVSYSCVST
jgi:hypothetical protein